MEEKHTIFFIEAIKKKLGWKILLPIGFILYFLTLFILTENIVLRIVFFLVGSTGIWAVEWALKEAERVLPLLNDGNCHWFKIIIISILLIFGALLFFLKPEQERIIVFDIEADCAEIAQSCIQQREEVNHEGDEIYGSLTNVLNERYAYNFSLNTCLVYFEVAVSDVGTTYNIVDAVNNDTIYKHLRYQPEHQDLQELWNTNCKKESGCIIDKSEFDLLVGELF
jgi:hypothetical protein